MRNKWEDEVTNNRYHNEIYLSCVNYDNGYFAWIIVLINHSISGGS